ncbi:serine protease [Flavobacterium plurextorum]|uniref:S1 family peptidase n=1 Tax=Flavobacterium plurextorum TaxID=1114867 RepID=UPI003756AB24
MKKILLFVLLILSYNSIFSQNTFFGNKLETDIRIKKLKESTVQILVDKEKCGTGFFVTDQGITVTNFHVIFNPKLKIQNNQVVSKLDIVNFKNDTIPVNFAIDLTNITVLNEARVWDYIILNPQKQIKTNFLKLGNFKNVYDGASVYTCGFPLDLKVPFITTGTFSTLDVQFQTIGTNKYERKIGWLDMTTNKGNSGGALILLGNTPNDDEVIGITSFILVPYYKELEELNNYVTAIEKKGDLKMLGINFLQYIKLINSATNSNSSGISGCISIEKLTNHFTTK